jgi:hypothetical protein
MTGFLAPCFIVIIHAGEAQSPGLRDVWTVYGQSHSAASQCTLQLHSEAGRSATVFMQSEVHFLRILMRFLHSTLPINMKTPCYTLTTCLVSCLH